MSSRTATADTFLAVGELLKMGARRVFKVEAETKKAEITEKKAEEDKEEAKVISPKVPKTQKIEIKK